MPVQKTDTLVIGEGWAALASALFSAQHQNVIWASGSGSRLLSPFPFVRGGLSERTEKIWKTFIQVGLPKSHPLYSLALDLEEGFFLNEYQNKAFRLVQTPNDIWSHEEVLFYPSQLKPLVQPAILEEAIRLEAQQNTNIVYKQSVPIQSIKEISKNRFETLFADSEIIESNQVIYADRWLGAGAYPKKHTFLKGLKPTSLLQVLFEHSISAPHSYDGAFMIPLPKEPGQEHTQHAWGYFYPNHKMSLWSVAVDPTETEDNHRISNKLRRLKRALNKAFGESGFFEQANKDFTQTVQSEKLRFEEFILFNHKPQPFKGFEKPILAQGVWYLTDGYGLLEALTQAYCFCLASSESFEGLTPKQNAEI